MKLTPRKGLLIAITLMFSQVCFATVTERTDKLGPEYDGVEVIADTGYGNTLFDSADNKCQHCHNDLYDTWKTSMHAKSWKDPIFQSKYQDFLRLQASKIGATGPTGTYSTGLPEDDGVTYLKGTIQKAGQVCVKCHAPTAFYSSDYKIVLTEVGDQNQRDEATYPEPEDDPNTYEYAKANLQSNLAPAYNPAIEATVVSMATTGKVYTVSYHIGNSHNREGINCAYCHSMETVRMFNDMDGDAGMYTLANNIKMGPIGPIVREEGSLLTYSPDASEPDMNAFFALIGPDKGDVQNTAKTDFLTWDQNKGHDGRYVMKSVKTGCETYDNDGKCTSGYYTGGPFYGPFGITGLSNSRDDDLSDRAELVKQAFQDAVDAADGDKFQSRHQFAAYGKALCLSCHQRSSLMLNPESADGGIQVDPDTKVVTSDHQFLELCSTWTAMSDGVGNNFEDTETSPKCQRCHMEPLTTIEYDPAVVLHKWDDYPNLFTTDDTELTHHFLPPPPLGKGTEGPVAEGYLNNHAFMGANTKDFGLTKIKTGFEAGLQAKQRGQKIVVNTTLQNKTAHMFPGAHPMRRVLTRLIVTDANGDRLVYRHAKGASEFNDVTNQLAVLEGNTIMPGFETVDVKYNKHADVVIQGYTPDFTGQKHVSSQYMDQTKVDWVSPDATVSNSAPQCTDIHPDTGDCIGSWVIKGTTTVKKISDIDAATDHFTRIYGRETGKRAADSTHVVRPGFDSNIAADNRLKPNEMEKYTVLYDTKDAVFPLKAEFRVYYLKKGGNGKFPTDPDTGFLGSVTPKDAIYEVARHSVTLN